MWKLWVYILLIWFAKNIKVISVFITFIGNSNCDILKLHKSHGRMCTDIYSEAQDINIRDLSDFRHSKHLVKVRFGFGENTEKANIQVVNLGMTTSVSQSATLFQTEISQQLFDGMAPNSVQAFVVPPTVLLTVVFP